MKRRWIALLAVLTLTGAACTQAEDDSGGGTDAPAVDEKNSFTVKVDGKSDKFAVESTAYFPSAVSVHPGDKVTFEEVFTGGPHTVTFGTLVDAAAAALDKLPPGQEEGPPIPEMDKLPDIFGPQETNFEPLNQSAGQPCFLATGEPVKGAQACEKSDQPDFDGKATFYNSGYLEDGDEFGVTFADDIKPGVYNYICLVHREGMRGTVTVADAAASIDDPEEVAKKGESELAKLESKLAPAFEMLKNATPDKAFVGNLAENVDNGLVAEFGPKEASIPVGGTMSWTVLHFHTIAINAPEDAINALIKESDGTIKLNPKAGAPTKGAPPPVVNLGPEAKAKTVQATYDGAGFFNSGIVASFPPNLLTYKVKFTKAGTYDLQCLVHPEMEGKVKVG